MTASTYILTPAGLTFTNAAWQPLSPRADWLEVATPTTTVRPTFRAVADGVVATAGSLTIRGVFAADPDASIALGKLQLTVTNTGSEPVACNLKWTWPLAEQQPAPRWLIPALLYKDNHQEYKSLPTLAGEPNLAEARSPWWTFKADHAAVPLVMAWTPGGSVALVMEERQAGYLNGLGLVNSPGHRALVGTWPDREEPRRRAPIDNSLEAVITFATLGPGATVTLQGWLHAGDTNPYAFAPVLRETFRRWDNRHPCHPWFPTVDGAAHAAHGLFRWHYDPDAKALWETCAYDGYHGKGPRLVDRFEMHTGFVSGVPYAHALRQFGLARHQPDVAEAGRRIIDFCCANLTPFGTFWSKFSRDEGWTTGWPSPRRMGPGISMGSESNELQARTLADATLFAARAALVESHAESRALWTRAVRSNLDFILALQRDGNPGEAYSGKDGHVLDWDGEAGLFWIAAFIEGYRLTRDERYLRGAIAAGEHFRPAVEDAYLTGAPESMHLLPTAEDPQNAVIAYVLLWEQTHDPRWLRLATLAGELMMTFRWQYNTEFPAFTILRQYDYRTKGLDIASTNNMHLHPYGLVALPEFVSLWAATGDGYFLRQTRNNLLGCQQMLAPVDGAFDAMRGMMTERWNQFGPAKGGTLPLSHAWAVGLVLYADLWVQQHGQIYLDEASGDGVALDAVELTRQPHGWTVHNPWPQPLDLGVVTRNARGELRRRHLRVAANAIVTV